MENGVNYVDANLVGLARIKNGRKEAFFYRYDIHRYLSATLLDAARHPEGRYRNG
jgi:hypothetical protein